VLAQRQGAAEPGFQGDGFDALGTTLQQTLGVAQTLRQQPLANGGSGYLPEVPGQ